jgi:hypothetical protein
VLNCLVFRRHASSVPRFPAPAAALDNPQD